MSLLYLLQLLDRYPLIVEAKGTYVNLMATTIMITTNHHPRCWYNYDDREENYLALERRIHKVLYFPKYGEAPISCDKVLFFTNYFKGMDVDGYIQEDVPATPVSSQHETDETWPSTEEDSADDDSPAISMDDQLRLDIRSRKDTPFVRPRSGSYSN